MLSAVVKFGCNGICNSKFKFFIAFFCFYFLYLALMIIFSVEKSLIVSFLGRYGLLPFVVFTFLLDLPAKDKYYVFKKFADLVAVITFISIFFWLFGSTLKILKPNSLFSYDWGQTVSVNSYYGLYFETQFVDWIGIDWFYRNTSIFVEGPMFCLVLILAIMFILTCPTEFKHKKIELAVLCIGLITTFSTTGLLFLGLLVLLYFYKEPKLRIFLLIILPVTIIAGIYFLIKKSGTGSFFLRLDDYVAGFKTWISKPLFGYGFGKFDAVIENMSRDDNIGFSNSIFAVLVQGGIVYGLLFIVPIFYGIMSGIKKKQRRLLFLSLCYALLFVLIVFQTAFINLYIWTCIFSFPVKNGEKKKYEIMPLCGK